MKNLIIFKVLTAVLISFLIFSCSDDAYSVEIDKTSITLTNTQNKQELNITSTGEWGIEANGLERYFGVPRAETDWYIVDRASGSADTKITFELKENIKTDKEAVIKIVGNYNTRTIILKYSSDNK